MVEQVLYKFFYNGSWVQFLVREGFSLIEKNNPYVVIDDHGYCDTPFVITNL